MSISSIFNFSPEQEKEVSSGAVIGYMLLGFAIIVILSFTVFIAVNKVKGDDIKGKEAISTEVIIEGDLDEEYRNEQ